MSDNEIILKCPICEKNDSPKLYVNVELGLMNCFRCGFKGSIKKLYKYPHIIEILKDKISLSEMSRLNKFKPLEQSSYSIFNELNPVREIIYTDPQFDYLVNRGWTDDMIFTYRPMLSLNNKFKDRVIIPIIDNEEIVYFTARDLSNNSKQKYLNAEVSRKNIIFKSKLDENMLFPEDCFFCEGIFDAAKLPNSIALLGKTISKENEQNILEFLRGKKRIYICLDYGAESCMNVIAKKLSSWCLHKELYIINTLSYDGKDLGKLAETNNSIGLVNFIKLNSKPYNSPTLTDNFKNKFNLVMG